MRLRMSDIIATMHFFKAIRNKVLYRLMLVYWFIARPTTAGVKCLVFHNDTLLFIKNSYGDAKWNLPGGGIESDETPAQAAKREVGEEVGITVSGVTYLGSFTSRREYKHDTVYCFAAHVSDDRYQIDQNEIKVAAWFAIQDLPDTISPLAREAIKLWRNHQ